MSRGLKEFAGNTWTRARYFSFIRSGLRRLWSKYPVKYQVLNEARRAYSGEDKRTKWEYQCNSCKCWFKSKEVEVDHIISAGTLKAYSDIPNFVEKLLCESDNLQVLCKECHQIKTQQEREDARKTS